MIIEEKYVSEIIQIVPEEIVAFVKEKHTDAVVNAAKPSLMGSEEPSVDRSIHNAIDGMLPDGRVFNDIIKEETDQGRSLPDSAIRCSRGQAVVTAGCDHLGCGLCKYVVHVVGTEYDGFAGRYASRKRTPVCTSSCIQKLECCYYEIVKTVMEQQDIATIAVPVVSSGNYGFPFVIAARIALASIGNALMEWRNKDPEFFNQSAIQKIYLCIYDRDPAEKDEKYRIAGEIWKDYEKILRYGNKVVAQHTVTAHLRYLNEIKKYDKNRGYFAIAKNFRFLLLVLRLFFLPLLLVKDWLGGYNWEKRRAVVEGTVIAKMMFPLLVYCIIKAAGYTPESALTAAVLINYCMIDTVTYLLVLIVLSDIQRPSANVIRSMIFLLVNYLEVSADIAVLYYLNNFGKIRIREAVRFGFLQETAAGCMEGYANVFLQYLNTGIKFFFLTLAFGYFADHLHQRKFRS